MASAVVAQPESTVASDAESQSGSRPRAEHLWKPGQSGNPRGRSKIDRDIALVARTYTEQAIHRLAELAMQDKHLGAAVRACEILLERGYGKAPVVVDVMHSIDSQSLQEAALAILRRRLEESRTVEAAQRLEEAKPK